MKRGDRVAIVCCSNGQVQAYKEKLDRLNETLKKIGLIPIWGNHIYEVEKFLNGSAKDKAKDMMNFYRDTEIKAIFDISGGDIANEVLPYLDYEVIADSEKTFFGYSDLTTIINAIYKKTGKSSVLYQIRNLIYEDSRNQIDYFTNTFLNDGSELFDISYYFIQKSEMKGVVVGGNIRCFLKLAGTEYWPEMKNKILLLEAFSGDVPQMVTYLNQLKQMKVFEQISGILLGTFTKMEEKESSKRIQELVKRYVEDSIPIACTTEIGHGVNSKAIVIGKEYYFKE